MISRIDFIPKNMVVFKMSGSKAFEPYIISQTVSETEIVENLFKGIDGFDAS